MKKRNITKFLIFIVVAQIHNVGVMAEPADRKNKRVNEKKTKVTELKMSRNLVEVSPRKNPKRMYH